MKTTKIILISSVLIVATIISSAFINHDRTNSPKENNKGFAVVELYTSEGCSSCPPADAVVAKLQKESNGKPIYILAFHVDYWNNLGWKDAFSSADYSNRQREYAHYIKNSQVYTPQVIVNGKTEFVGSEENTLRNAVKTALQKDELTQLSLVNMQTTRQSVQVNYQIEGNANHSALLLALVQKSAQSQVKAGENSGRNLSHVQIVQQLQTIALNNNKTGVEKIVLPANFTPQNWEVIGFIQNTTTGEIIGAAKAGFGTNSSSKNVE